MLSQGGATVALLACMHVAEAAAVLVLEAGLQTRCIFSHSTSRWGSDCFIRCSPPVTAPTVLSPMFSSLLFPPSPPLGTTPLGLSPSVTPSIGSQGGTRSIEPLVPVTLGTGFYRSLLLFFSLRHNSQPLPSTATAPL